MKVLIFSCIMVATMIGIAASSITKMDDGRQRHYTEQDGFTPWSIDQAMFDGNIVYLKKSIDSGWDINEQFVSRKYFDGRLALELIIGNHMARTARPVSEFLVAAGADVNARDRNGELPLATAVRWLHVDIVELLLANGADPNIYARTGKDRRTPIMELGFHRPHRGAVRIVELLLDAGADVSLKDGLGRPAYAHAEQGGNMQAVERIKQEMRRLGLEVE